VTCKQIIFLFAPQDTTASALNSTFYALARNQKWQDQLPEEYISMDKNDLTFDDFPLLEKTD